VTNFWAATSKYVTNMMKIYIYVTVATVYPRLSRTPFGWSSIVVSDYHCKIVMILPVSTTIRKNKILSVQFEVPLIRVRDASSIVGSLVNMTIKHLNDFKGLWREQLRTSADEDQYWDWEQKQRIYLAGGILLRSRNIRIDEGIAFSTADLKTAATYEKELTNCFPGMIISLTQSSQFIVFSFGKTPIDLLQKLDESCIQKGALSLCFATTPPILLIGFLIPSVALGRKLSLPPAF
jgi:hypothetical protein